MEKHVPMCDNFKKCMQYLYREKLFVKTDEMYGIQKDTSVWHVLKMCLKE